jgi:hypothetical protein
LQNDNGFGWDLAERLPIDERYAVLFFKCRLSAPRDRNRDPESVAGQTGFFAVIRTRTVIISVEGRANPPATSRSGSGHRRLLESRTLMEKFIHRENLALYKKRLAEPHTDAERSVLLKLLAEEEAKEPRPKSRE